MAAGGPDLRHVTPRASVPPVGQGTMSTPDLAATVARGVAAAATQILERFTRLIVLRLDVGRGTGPGGFGLVTAHAHLPSG